MKRRQIALSLTAVLFALLVSEASAVTISGFTTINDPSAPTTSQGTVLNAVSGNNVVGHYFDASGHLNGFEYNTATNTWTNLQDPSAAPVSQGGGTIPYGISGNNIVGDFNDTSNNENGFLYNGTTWTSLDDPSAYRPEGTIATGISGNNIAGYYYTSGAVAHGFLYNMTTQAWTTLNAPFPSSQTTTMVFGIGGNYVVGEYYNGGFLYNMSTNVWTILEDPFGNSPGPQGISGNNVVGIDSVLVGSVYVEEGFLYNIPTNTWSFWEDPLADLTVSANRGTTAFGFDGANVVGWYGTKNASGGSFFNGYEAVVPEPSSIILLAFGATAIGGFLVTRHRHKSQQSSRMR